jgi:hypothetical protein
VAGNWRAFFNREFVRADQGWFGSFGGGGMWGVGEGIGRLPAALLVSQGMACDRGMFDRLMFGILP